MTHVEVILFGFLSGAQGSIADSSPLNFTCLFINFETKLGSTLTKLDPVVGLAP